MAIGPQPPGGAPAVIPRYQKILLTLLLIASLGMGFKLWQLRDSAHKHLLAAKPRPPHKPRKSLPLNRPLLSPPTTSTIHWSPRCTPCPSPLTREHVPALSSANCSISTLPLTPPTPSRAVQPLSPRSFCCPCQSPRRPHKRRAI